jgi:flagellar biosynthesis/type III secretory pathway chaperone
MMENRTDKNQDYAAGLHETLQELIGLHRQLYEVVKSENEAITQADVRATYEATSAKEALIHWIHQAELSRQIVVRNWCEAGQINPAEASLRNLILRTRERDSALADRLQADLSTLMVLVERIKKQNELNGSLVNESLKHIQNMKQNIFGETNPKAATYNQSGQRNTGSSNAHGPRLISKEV